MGPVEAIVNLSRCVGRVWERRLWKPGHPCIWLNVELLEWESDCDMACCRSIECGDQCGCDWFCRLNCPEGAEGSEGIRQFRQGEVMAKDKPKHSGKDDGQPVSPRDLPTYQPDKPTPYDRFAAEPSQIEMDPRYDGRDDDVEDAE